MIMNILIIRKAEEPRLLEVTEKIERRNAVLLRLDLWKEIECTTVLRVTMFALTNHGIKTSAMGTNTEEGHETLHDEALFMIKRSMVEEDTGQIVLTLLLIVVVAKGSSVIVGLEEGTKTVGAMNDTKSHMSGEIGKGVGTCILIMVMIQTCEKSTLQIVEELMIVVQDYL